MDSGFTDVVRNKGGISRHTSIKNSSSSKFYDGRNSINEIANGMQTPILSGRDENGRNGMKA